MATKKARLHKLEQEMEYLTENHILLLRAARIGKFKPNMAAADDEEQPQEIPISLKKRHHFQDVYDQTQRQQFISQTAANQIVQSAQNLIELINELKIAYTVNENK